MCVRWALITFTAGGTIDRQAAFPASTNGPTGFCGCQSGSQIACLLPSAMVAVISGVMPGGAGSSSR